MIFFSVAVALIRALFRQGLSNWCTGEIKCLNRLNGRLFPSVVTLIPQYSRAPCWVLRQRKEPEEVPLYICEVKTPWVPCPTRSQTSINGRAVLQPAGHTWNECLQMIPIPLARGSLWDGAGRRGEPQGAPGLGRAPCRAALSLPHSGAWALTELQGAAAGAGEVEIRGELKGWCSRSFLLLFLPFTASLHCDCNHTDSSV